jgi:hypothetical protein
MRLVFRWQVHFRSKVLLMDIGHWLVVAAGLCAWAFWLLL